MKKLLMIICISIYLCSPCLAENLRLAWDQNISDDFAGWKVYKANSPMANCKVDGTLHSELLYDPSTTEYTTQLTLEGDIESFYFALTAFDLGRNESNCSNQVSLPPNTPFSLIIEIVE